MQGIRIFSKKYFSFILIISAFFQFFGWDNACKLSEVIEPSAMFRMPIVIVRLLTQRLTSMGVQIEFSNLKAAFKSAGFMVIIL